jgi:hypothetical protein
VAVVVDNEVKVVVVVLVKVEDEVEVDDLLVECCELGLTCGVMFREVLWCLDI